MHLDYVSCALTIISTFLVGRRNWAGLVLAAVNSLIVCDIGWKTAQIGLIPANVFCLGVYVFSVRSWRRQAANKQSAAENKKQEAQIPVQLPLLSRILARVRGAASQNEANAQEAPLQTEIQRPIQFKPANAAISRERMQHNPRRRQVRSSVAWARPGVYSRAAAR